MRAVLVGAVNSTAVALEAITRSPGWPLPMVVTLPEEPSKRDSDFCVLAPLARQYGAELCFARTSNDAATIAAIREPDPDYIFVIGWSQICKPEFLSICPGTCVGYHPAPLPRLRAAVPWTILPEEPITAGSLFWLANATDTGDLLAQDFFHVAHDETARELYDKHMSALRRMLVRILPELASGIETRISQDERYATMAAKRTRADGMIGWRRGADGISRSVRAVGRPYPGAFTSLAGSRWWSGPRPRLRKEGNITRCLARS